MALGLEVLDVIRTNGGLDGPARGIFTNSGAYYRRNRAIGCGVLPDGTPGLIITAHTTLDTKCINSERGDPKPRAFRLRPIRAVA